MNVVPEPEEIVQTEEESYTSHPIPVVTCGPVETREVPAKSAGYTTHAGATAQGVLVLPYEPRRKSAILTSYDEAMWIGPSQQSVILGGMGAFRVPALALVTLTHMDEVWAAPVQDVSDISVLTEYWSE